MFEQWLEYLDGGKAIYQSATYSHPETEAYYVADIPEFGVVGCGGFYLDKDSKEARLAWGMIHVKFHRQGLGAALYHYRKEVIHHRWPNHALTLGTSQYTYPFYEKMGLRVTCIIPQGYGKELDRYDMSS